MKYLDFAESTCSPQSGQQNFGMSMVRDLALAIGPVSGDGGSYLLGMAGTIGGTSAGIFRGIASEGMVPFTMPMLTSILSIPFLGWLAPIRDLLNLNLDHGFGTSVRYANVCM